MAGYRKLRTVRTPGDRAGTACPHRRASSATNYALFVGLPGEHDTRHRWIPKCRTRLERDEDCPVYENQWSDLRRRQEEAGPATFFAEEEIAA